MGFVKIIQKRSTTNGERIKFYIDPGYVKIAIRQEVERVKFYKWWTSDFVLNGEEPVAVHFLQGRRCGDNYYNPRILSKSRGFYSFLVLEANGKIKTQQNKMSYHIIVKVYKHDDQLVLKKRGALMVGKYLREIIEIG